MVLDDDEDEDDKLAIQLVLYVQHNRPFYWLLWDKYNERESFMIRIDCDKIGNN